MKIKIEGYFSRLATDIALADNETKRQELIAQIDKSVGGEEYPATKQALLSNEDAIMQKFKDYVNHSRSPWKLTANNQFTGSRKTLQSFADSFAKKFKGINIVISEDYVEGEFIPVVRKIISNGGGEE